MGRSVAEAVGIVTPESPGWRSPAGAYQVRNRRWRWLRVFSSFIVPPKYYRMRLTFSGWALLVIALAMGGAAYNTSSNILFMSLSLILSSLVMSGFLSFFNFKKISWMLDVPRHLRVAEPSTVSVRVKNEKKWLPTFSFWFRVRLGKSGRYKPLTHGGVLFSERIAEMPWRFTPEARGELCLNVSGIESKYPFGFFKKTIGVPIAHKTIVWPERLEYRLLLQAGRRPRAGQGQRYKVGAGDDLAGLRIYQEGDDLRSIHWKASARSEQFLVKQFDNDGGQGMRLAFSSSKKLWSDKEMFENAVRAVASVAEDFYRRGELISVRIDEDEPVNIFHPRDMYAVMDQLALIQRGKAAWKQPDLLAENEIYLKPGEGTAVEYWLRDECVGRTIQ